MRISPSTPARGYLQLAEEEDQEDGGNEFESSDEETFSTSSKCCSSSCCAFAKTDDIDFPDSSWVDKLTYTDKVKIGLARALLLNPEMLVLHRPFHHFVSSTSKEVFDVIKKHHANRGLGLPELWTSRRPRSIFFSAESKSQAVKADVLWQLDLEKKTVSQICHEQLTKL